MPKLHLGYRELSLLEAGVLGCVNEIFLSFYMGLNIIDGTSATLFVQAEIPFGILLLVSSLYARA